MHETDNMPFEVDETSDLPIWVQLRNRFAFLIKTGHFKDGEQLPSVRSLAASAMINYNTVARAYRDLELEGLVVSVRGRGMFVQGNRENGKESETASADALLEDCVRQYRALGMTYEDIHEHMSTLVSDLKSKADDELSKRMEFCK